MSLSSEPSSVFIFVIAAKEAAFHEFLDSLAVIYDRSNIVGCEHLLNSLDCYGRRHFSGIHASHTICND